METTELLKEIRALSKRHTNQHVQDWKDSGKPVIGYFCQYTPPELILAAGALPLRLRGSGSDDSSLGDAYLSGRTCTYVRHVMSLVLDEAFQFLDGEITVNTCDHVRRAADVFRKKTDIAFHGFISVPRSPRESLYDYYLEELKKLKGELEEHFSVRIGEEDLRRAIKDMNANRRRLKRINEMRMEERPKLSGADALAVHIASMSVPPEVFGELADRLIEALEKSPGLDPPAARLVLTGTELDDPEYVDAIESQNALVVADHLCFGARSVLEDVDEKAEDPLDAIARATFFRTSCARMMGDFPNRWESMNKLAKEAKADGLVFQRLMFCDPWGGELHNILYRSKKENGRLPVLSLTREYGILASGQVKTRMQAFVEKIEIARVRNAANGGGE